MDPDIGVEWSKALRDCVLEKNQAITEADARYCNVQDLEGNVF